MSSRQLRKLRKQTQPFQAEAEVSPGDGSSSDDEPVYATPRANVFSAFAALGEDEENNDGNKDDDDDEDDDNDDKTSDTHSKHERAEAVATTPRRADGPASVKKNRRSKKKKKGKKLQATTDNQHEPGTDSKVAAEGVDEIDRAIRELNLKAPSENQAAGRDGSSTEPSQRLHELLRINFHHLKVINEMRRVFGKDTIEAAQADEEAQTAMNMSRRARTRPREVDLETFLRGTPGKAISEVLLRRNPFIEGRSYWPRASSGGLTMTTVGDADDGYVVEFTFSHDKTYDALEGSFFGLVQMYDPMQLVHFLHRNPYHVSTLIQVSKVAKQDQNMALSSELCERALFTLGRVTLSSFRKKLEQGTARMNFHRPENRQFWLAGYNYIKSLIMKGTYRTALEWTKLFLSISHDDPYGIINWVHVLAIRAHEAEWFIELCNTGFLSSEKPEIRGGDYIKQTLVLANLQRDDAAGAEAAAIAGMQQLPWLYGALFSALSLDIPKSIWGVQPRSEDEELYTQLYIHMTKDLWNNSQATALLVKAGSLVPKVDAGQLSPGPLVTLETARFIYLDNTPSLMALVPHGLLHVTPNFDFDPLPPPEEKNVFSSRTQELPWIATSHSDAHDAGRGQAGGVPAPGNIPEDELRALDELINDASSPNERQGILRYILDSLSTFGMVNANGEEAGEPGAMRLPGAWQDDDDEDVGPWAEADDFEDEDDFGDVDEMGRG